MLATSDRPMAIVTGFGPFQNVPVNPSWAAVRTLPETLAGVDLIKMEVPVVYEAVQEQVPPLHAGIQPVCVIHVGVGNRGQIKLERQAHNGTYALPDTVGCLPPKGLANPESACEVLSTPLDLDAAIQSMARRGWTQVGESCDAGKFLCEFIYYTSLYTAREAGTPCLFVHVPPVGHPFSQDQISAALRDLVEIILLQVAARNTA
ncbi:hypothetical protein BC831DRAFT_449893 [Entophlyctis helioformis]|nr:hypothetical protein BC831DRAFT_449893 [Entophlyctis helioformis]